MPTSGVMSRTAKPALKAGSAGGSSAAKVATEVASRPRTIVPARAIRVIDPGSVVGSGTGDQLGDGPPVVDDRERPAESVGDGGTLVVDAQVAVDRRQEVVGADAAVGHLLAAAVGGPDDLAGVEAAAGPDHRVGQRPVVAAGLDDPGRRAGHAAAA